MTSEWIPSNKIGIEDLKDGTTYAMVICHDIAITGIWNAGGEYFKLNSGACCEPHSFSHLLELPPIPDKLG